MEVPSLFLHQLVGNSTTLQRRELSNGMKARTHQFFKLRARMSNFVPLRRQLRVTSLGPSVRDMDMLGIGLVNIFEGAKLKGVHMMTRETFGNSIGVYLTGTMARIQESRSPSGMPLKIEEGTCIGFGFFWDGKCVGSAEGYVLKNGAEYYPAITIQGGRKTVTDLTVVDAVFM